MAARPYWKGHLCLSLVSCPIQLFPATGEREKISFHQINKATGHRIRYRKVDEVTGEEVASDQSIKGYEIAKGQYIEITNEELEAITLESIGPTRLVHPRIATEVEWPAVSRRAERQRLPPALAGIGQPVDPGPSAGPQIADAVTRGQRGDVQQYATPRSRSAITKRDRSNSSAMITVKIIPNTTWNAE